MTKYYHLATGLPFYVFEDNDDMLTGFLNGEKVQLHKDEVSDDPPCNETWIKPAQVVDCLPW